MQLRAMCDGRRPSQPREYLTPRTANPIGGAGRLAYRFSLRMRLPGE
jgi:hypothetical protein